jgi:hypothetical protein
MVLFDPRTKEAECCSTRAPRKQGGCPARAPRNHGVAGTTSWKLGAGDQQHYGSSVQIVSRS